MEKKEVKISLKVAIIMLITLIIIITIGIIFINKCIVNQNSNNKKRQSLKLSRHSKKMTQILKIK